LTIKMQIATAGFHIFLLLGALSFPLRLAAAEAGATSPAASTAPRGADTPSDGGARSRLTIESDSTCPSGPAVADALAALVPPAQWPSGKVGIQAVADALVVQLISTGTTKRVLHVTPDCDLRADTVALVIATWTGELASDVAGEPVLPGQAASASGAPSARIHPVTMPVPPVVVPATEHELAAGALVSVSGGIAPGVRIDFVTSRAPRGMGWQVGLTLPARRDLAAGSVSASWTRAAASIAIHGRMPLRRLLFSADAGIALAYTFASAYGYAIYQGEHAITGGLVAGARLAFPWRSVRLWAELRAYGWLVPQAIAVDSSAGNRLATRNLPSSDFQSAVGLAYLFH
jgi:hypothetical protein